VHTLPGRGRTRRAHAATLLLTAFDPFGGQATNVSELVVRAVGTEWPVESRVRLTVAILPTKFTAAGDAIVSLIRAHWPNAIVCCGLAESERGLCFERLARNCDCCDAPDNAGESRLDAIIDADGPPTYRATLPYAALSRALRARRIAHRYSDDAGGFVCNHVFYRASREIARSGRTALCGFIHFPSEARAERALAPDGLPLVTSVEALRVCLDTLAGAL
jgi:pyroglutamyl-peptidase